MRSLTLSYASSTDVEAPWEDLDDDGEQMLLPQDSGEDLVSFFPFHGTWFN